jgi:hypothetical protein
MAFPGQIGYVNCHFPRHYYELVKVCLLHQMRLLHISRGNDYLIYDPTCFTIKYIDKVKK